MFAAYSEKVDSELHETRKETEESWLKNASFLPGISQQTSVAVNREVQCIAALDVTSTSSRPKLPNLSPTSEYTLEQATTYHTINPEELKKRKKKEKKRKGNDKDKKSLRNKETEKIKEKKVEQIVSQVFFEDCKGDKNNMAFPHMYFKDVPR